MSRKHDLSVTRAMSLQSMNACENENKIILYGTQVKTPYIILFMQVYLP